MKISNEAKIGVLAIVSIVVLILGFNFLKGSQVFSKAPTVYAVFDKIGSLEKSNQIRINGLPVGTVYDVKPVDREVNRILVEIHLSKDISIPDNSIAFIDGTLLGATYINIEKGASNNYLKSGDTISTRLDPTLMEDLKTQLQPTVVRVNETLDSLKLVIGNMNSIFDPNTNNNLQAMIARLTIASGHLEQLLNTQTGTLGRSLENMNSITGNLARNNESITSSIRNVETTTSNLSNARIKETIAELEGTIAEFKGAAAGLQTSINRINSPDGTLGALMNDKKLYEQLNKAALGLEILLDDVRVHPKRYVNISVFGGKATPAPLTSPVVKDTVAVTQK
jgi:phospholipid/cholesterol/gamma-HCH transport system substrate-binding protein